MSLMNAVRGQEPLKPQKPLFKPTVKEAKLPSVDTTTKTEPRLKKPSVESEKQSVTAARAGSKDASKISPSTNAGKPIYSENTSKTKHSAPKTSSSSVSVSASRKPANSIHNSSSPSNSRSSSSPNASPIASASVNSTPSKRKSELPVPAKKKLSFKDVMKQAKTIDKSKLEVNIRGRKAAPQPVSSRRNRAKDKKDESIVEENKGNKLTANRNSEERLSSSSRDSDSKTIDSRKAFRNRTPAPMAQPSPELLKRQRKNSSRAGRYYDEELDDFVVDEDTYGDMGYGNRYRYADEYSDSDMEATGGDILEEERASYHKARREDVEEERRLEELARLKQMRKSRA